jgi:hypothetical protein
MKDERSLHVTARNLPETANDLGVCGSEIEQRDGCVHIVCDHRKAAYVIAKTSANGECSSCKALILPNHRGAPRFAKRATAPTKSLSARSVGV